MQSWNLRTSSGTKPGRRQLFSTPEARVELIDLDPDAELADPGGGARVVIQVLSGRVGVFSGEDATSYGDGTLVALEPGEAGAVRALEQSRLLRTISPRPAPRGHSPGSA